MGQIFDDYRRVTNELVRVNGLLERAGGDIAAMNCQLAQAKALGAEWEGKYERAVQTVQYQDEVILKLKAKLREKVSGVIVVDRAPKKPIAGAVKPKEPTT
jgi:hypothetical protein